MKRKYYYSIRLIALFYVVLLPVEAIFASRPPGRRFPHQSPAERIGRLAEFARASQDSDPRKTREYCEEAFQLLRDNPDKKQEMEFLTIFAESCNLMGDYLQAERYGMKARKLAHKLKEKVGEADALYTVARSYWYRERFDEARECYLRAYRLYQVEDHKEGLARSYQLMGLISWRLGDFNNALEFLQKATDAFEVLEYDKGIADIDNIRGVLSLDLKKEKKALVHFEKARRIYSRLGDLPGVSKAVHNMGLAYSRMGNYSKALELYRETLDIANRLGAKFHICYSLNNIGEAYYGMEQYNMALDYFQKAAAIARQLDLPNDVAVALTNIGRIKRKTKQYGEAVRILEQARDVTKKAGAKEELRDVVKELAEIHDLMGNYKKSLVYYREYKEIEDGILEVKSSQKVAAIQSRFEIGKKENRLVLLKKSQQVQQLEFERQRNMTISFAAVFLLIFLLAFVLFNRYRLKNKITLALKKEVEEHKETDRKLRESEEKFRTLAEKSVVGICIIQDDVIKYVNPRFLMLFDYCDAEVLFQSPLKMVLEEDRALVASKLKRREEGGNADESAYYEFRGVKKDGTVIYLESYGVATYYQGEAAVLETVIEVTDRKKAESELLKVRKLESVGILAGGIANDFNNLLSVIIDNAVQLRTDVGEEPFVSKMVDSIEKASHQATDLARKLITFSAGGESAPGEIALVDVIKSVTDVYPHFRKILRPASIPAGLNPLYGDERQLGQVIGSLLWNAEEAGREAEDVEVTITAENITLDSGNEFSLPQGDFVQAAVSDNGRGISPEQLEKVFDPYYSTKETVTQKGMGLGLAICYAMIKKNNGHISIQSDVGKGTTVRLIIPAASPGASEDR